MHDGEAVDLFRGGGFFDPVRAILFYLMSPLEGVVLCPSAVGVEHEFGIVADCFAENADELDVLAHAFWAGSGAVTHEPLLIAIAFALDCKCACANGCRFEREAEAAGVHLYGGAWWASEQAVDENAKIAGADLPYDACHRDAGPSDKAG